MHAHLNAPMHPPPLVPSLKPQVAAAAQPLRRRVLALVAAIAFAAQPLAPAVTDIGLLHAQSLAPRAQPLPDLGDESQAMLSPVQERKLGESIIRQVRASGAYMNDPEVNDYLEELGHRLVAAVPEGRRDFEFFAVPDPAINAFALPGGYVGVNTGLILLAQNESELAAVLAHEISHVTQHHVTRMIAGQQRTLLLSLAALAVAIAAARAGSGQAASAAAASAQALGIQSQLNFTRDHEYEADRIGFQRLDAAGFDVTAPAAFMERLQRASRFAEGNTPSYLRTHPITYERIAEAQSRAQFKPYRQIPDSLDFHLVRALLRSYNGTPQEAVQSFENALAERKFNNEIAARYGLVASLLRARDYKRAKSEMATLEKMAPPHPMIDAMVGHVYLDAGDVDLAINRFGTALARYPNKMQLVYDYPEALLTANRPKEAVAFLERELVRFPNDGRLHRSAAKAYAALGKQMQQHRHQAEFYAWQGDLRGAVTQLELASKAGDGDFYQASVVETRLRTLRQELQEQQRVGLTRSG